MMQVTARIRIGGPKFSGALTLGGFATHDTAREVSGVFCEAFEAKYPGHTASVADVVGDLRPGLSENTQGQRPELEG